MHPVSASPSSRRLSPGPAPEPVLLAPDAVAPAPLVGPAMGTASVFLQWFNWCGARPAGPLTLRVTLPDGGTLRTPAAGDLGLPRCDDAAAGSSVAMGPFEAVPAPIPSEPPAIPDASLRVTLRAPAQAVAGQPLRYTALLANPGTTPVRLTPCPTYQERLNAPGGSVVREYVLNCAGAPVIAPGERVAFAIVLDVPVSLPPTSDSALVWTLDPFYGEGFPPSGPAVKVPLTVVAAAPPTGGSGTTGP